jgi:hypothetical protein
MDAINLDDLFNTNIGDDHHVVSHHNHHREGLHQQGRMRAYSSGDSASGVVGNIGGILLGGEDNSMMMDDELDFDISGDIFECSVLDGSFTSMHSQTFATSSADAGSDDIATALTTTATTGGGGVRNNDTQDMLSRRRSSFNIDRMVTVASRGPRTARVNPHLAMREQEQQQQQQGGGGRNNENCHHYKLRGIMWMWGENVDGARVKDLVLIMMMIVMKTKTSRAARIL